MLAIDVLCRRRLVGRIVLVALLMFMSGCAAKQTSTPPGNETPAQSGDTPAQSDPPERLTRIERDIAALRDGYDPAQPPIDRLAAIEGDLHGLVAELQARAVPVPAPAMVMAPIDPPRVASPGTFGVHLANYQQKESVLEGWRDYNRQYRGVLDGLSPRVATIDFKDGRGTFYRLKAGPFVTEAAALAACRKIVTYPAGYCKVTDFSGTPGETFWRRGAS